MNSEIAVGEYIRTKQGYVGKYQKSVVTKEQFKSIEYVV